MFGVFSGGVAKIPGLKVFLGGDWVKVGPGRTPNITKVVGWGYKPTSVKARNFAVAKNIPYVSLEDGFLRSIGLGVDGIAPLSLVVDDVGIYYDSSRPSRLEKIILKGGWSLEARSDARRALALVRLHRLTKYNSADNAVMPFLNEKKKRVLIVDQTFGDASVTMGGGSVETFQSMIDAARYENPGADLWVKIHPDVLAGKKKGYLGVLQSDDIGLVQDDSCPMSLISHFDHVYVVTSQMGFDALLMGKPVTCFGNPWYAGWGVTDDRHAQMEEIRSRRCATRTVEELFTAAYMDYARYLDPTTGKLGTIFHVIDWLVRNKSIHRDGAGMLYCVGMSRWKRAIIKPFLKVPGNRLCFVGKLKATGLHALNANARIVIWGDQHRDLRYAAEKLNIPVIRVEDGFIRSSGLGSDLFAPLSLSVDDSGIFYDPKSGSRLESLLNTCCLSDEERTRASNVIKSIIRARISKYNVGIPFEPSLENHRRVLLVPGQVEDDASIRSGSPVLRSNKDLLAAVRKANPDAWIIYKPHPDVVAGNRSGHVSESDLKLLSNEVVIDGNISDCIMVVDEVHTMTSQAGFEALLYGKVVHCYGAPFYAGWQLTIDHVDLPQRQRQLTIEELVFVALCQYPRYRLPGIDGFCAVESIIEYLASSRQNESVKVGSHWLARQWRKARQLAYVLRMP
ncbi:Beta-3-deoxy-D-manno-oct-2-ulosonic acid transferase [Cupriavidus oxalaticus]|uniref:capsular polysaccharide biosynthesis protein n=1 Tax=Cupriavidus oxalaticus TaxID=96344 RepID=UPI003F73A120